MLHDSKSESCDSLWICGVAEGAKTRVGFAVPHSDRGPACTREPSGVRASPNASVDLPPGLRSVVHADIGESSHPIRERGRKIRDDRGVRRSQAWARSALRRLGASGAIRQSADPGQPEHRQPNRGSTLRRIRGRRRIRSWLGTSHRSGVALSGSVPCATDRRRGNRPGFNEPRPKARDPRASSFPRNDPRAFVDATQPASWRRRRIHHWMT